MRPRIKNIIESYGIIMILVLCVILLFRSCSQANTIKVLSKQVEVVDSLNRASISLTKQDVDRIVSDRLYDFLIFEDDLDKKKTSLTDIRLKISKDAKK